MPVRVLKRLNALRYKYICLCILFLWQRMLFWINYRGVIVFFGHESSPITFICLLDLQCQCVTLGFAGFCVLLVLDFVVVVRHIGNFLHLTKPEHVCIKPVVENNINILQRTQNTTTWRQSKHSTTRFVWFLPHFNGSDC